ncbi:unnamed protein product [Eruca vesicaria subsp. sativa]|uniref:Uncharacterized protein n=1 Tax=Eruca vesicaria subsp. sativa TaxID=29727 RepID=A0ABC8ITV7_ERUVS|nr:unnamed protein product [Eruca vesicaria subsp. sativa]
MRRSASASVVSDQLSAKPPSPSPSPPRIQSSTDLEDVQLLLPRYDPNSYPGKKDKSRIRSAENAIHFIPLLLILCALILWLVSNPGNNRFRQDIYPLLCLVMVIF